MQALYLVAHTSCRHIGGTSTQSASQSVIQVLTSDVSRQVTAMTNILVEAVPLVDVPTASAAPQATEDEAPVPPQYQQARVNDFRRAGFAPKGYKQNAVKSGSSKRKLDEYQEQVRKHYRRDLEVMP